MSLPKLAPQLIIPAVFLISGSCLMTLVNEQVQSPYMDEYFHNLQTSRYCSGRWNVYDSKITTPPGLYTVTLLLLRAMMWLGLSEDVCWDIYSQRGVVLLHGVLLVWICAKVMLHHNPTVNSDTRLLWATEIATFPLVLFYSLLFYTDVPAAFYIISSYYLMLLNYPWFSSIVATIAVLHRQTNIVWAAMIVVLDMESLVLNVLKRRKRSRGKISVNTLLSWVFRNKTKVLKKYFGFIILAMVFLSTFAWNNFRLTFGDHEHHTPSLHWAQIVYCAAAVLCGVLFHALDSHFITRLTGRWVYQTCALSLLGIFLCAYGEIAHPFLLADNRHITFYVWRKALRFIGVRTLLGMTFGPIVMILQVMVKGSALRLGLIALTATATLLPAPLLEPRYFLVPYLFTRLHIGRGHQMRSLANIIIFLIIDFLLLGIFLHHPFYQDSALQRIML